MVGVDQSGRYDAPFSSRATDQRNRSDAFGVADDGAQGGAGRRDRVQVRSGRSAVAEAWRLGRDPDGDLEAEAKLPKRERRSTQRLFEELRGRGYDGAHDSVIALRRHGGRNGPSSGAGVRADELCAGRSLSVRLEPRDDHAQGLPLTVKAAHMKLSHSRMSGSCWSQ